jgi:hypothetical protein
MHALNAAALVGDVPPPPVELDELLLHAAESSARTLSAATVLAVPFTDTSYAGRPAAAETSPA